MLNAAPLVAFWSWGSGWMLLWGLAGAIPVAIHLWNRRQQEVVSWAAMEFLLTAVRRHARRIRMEQWLLLALRVSILLVLAAALADPLLSLLPQAPVPIESRGRTHKLLVLDGSFSMACWSGELSNLERAQELAVQIVGSSAQGDGFSLVVMSDPPRAIIRDIVFDGNDVADELRAIEQRHTGADLASTLDEVQRIVQQAKLQHPRFVEHQICIFTDLGLSTWDAVRADPVRQRLASLGEIATLFLYEIGRPESSNVAITRFASDEPLAVAGTSLRAEVEVANFGDQSERRQLAFLADGSSVAEETLDIAAGSTQVRAFEHRFELPGPHVFEARLDEDVLSIDDHRWLGVQIREAVRVLCVEGKQGAAKFVALALAPLRGPARIQPDVAGEHALLEFNLPDYDCVFLCNIGRFGSQEAAVLYEYVRHGGGLVTVLGDRVQATSYNEMLAGELTAKRVLPARLGGVQGQGRRWFDPLQYQHPIVAPFRGHERSGLLKTPVWQFVQLSPFSPGAKPALAFDNGEAALVTESIGHGRSVLSATDFSVEVATATPWNAIATSQSFPPLVHEILRYALGGRLASRNAQVGQLLSARLTGSGAIVTPPDGKARPATVSGDEGPARWTYADTYVSGVYRVQPVGAEKEAEVFGVNVDAAESDLARFEAELLPVQFSDVDLAAPAEATLADRGSQFPLYRLLLAALLVLLIAESTAACWLGRRTA